MDQIKAVKGTYDILPSEVEVWQEVERVVRSTMELFGYSEIRTPIFEETVLFARSIGEETDIVGKEMYTFRDMGERSITLRPEGTASVVRAFIEHSLHQKGLPQSLWYMGPMFRQERPQKGRQRQFHQFGVEVIGSSSPLIDADVIILFDIIAEKLKLQYRVVSINTFGGIESRKKYLEKLLLFLEKVENNLCDDCKRRKRTNPLRILDCKVPTCRTIIRESDEVPDPEECLDLQDRMYYETVQDVLNNYDIDFKKDKYLVRGLDYYTGIVFEMEYQGLGAQSAIMGGGRYDNLVKQLGGPDLPAAGFACGMERLVLAMKIAGYAKTVKSLDVFLIDTTNDYKRAMNYLQKIRKENSAVMSFTEKSMKSNLRAAWKYKAKYAVIIEPEEDIISVRDMYKSTQEKMTFDKLVQFLQESKSPKT